MRRRWKRVAWILLVIFTLLYMTACQVLENEMAGSDDTGLMREEKSTDTPWTISYLRAGNPEAQRLIYIHGTPGSATAFRRYLTNPMQGFDSISIDRPGFGKTRPRKPALTLHEQAAVIRPFLEERNGQWPILVGHSLGAPIICRAAVDYPDRVGGLVILCGSLDPELEKIAWYQKVVNFAFFPYLIPRTLRNSNRELFPMRDELIELQPMLAGIRCPIVILHAPNDILVPYENVAYMQAAFPSDQLKDTIILEGKNHFIPWNAEDAVRRAIREIAGQGGGAVNAPQ